MSSSVLGGDKLADKLRSIAESMVGTVRVGFLEGGTYPDGTPTAAVAFWNEFGNGKAPPRPFFRRMIATESPTWGGKMSKLAKMTNYNGKQVLEIMGDDIKGALQQSIVEFSTPALAASTVARKGFDKPLIETGNMKDSVDYEVV